MAEPGHDRGMNGHGPLRNRKRGDTAARVDSFPAYNPRDGRRPSGFSNYSAEDVDDTASFSMDASIFSRPAESSLADHLDATNWHSAPLAFALLPAVAGLVFHNGGAIATDVTLLALAGVFLNWSVRMPWDWYRSSRSFRVEHLPNGVHADEEREAASGSDAPTARSGSPKPDEAEVMDARAEAEAELRRHELAALLACFLLPMAGAWLLHAIRSQLSRPSEGLVSNYNLTIFLLASEMRPVAHLLKMIQGRTLHLQKTVHTNPFQDDGTDKVATLTKRLEALEARAVSDGSARRTPDAEGAEGSAASVTAEVRRTLQPDVDALNRAVRRYEKRATVQSMQTESRLQDLEARVNDAISLAAAAAQGGQGRSPRSGGSLAEWIFTAMALPFRTMLALFSLPAKLSTVAFYLGRALTMLGLYNRGETADARYRTDARAKERSQRRSTAKRAVQV